MREAVGFGAMNMDRFYRVERIVVDDEAVVEDYQSLPGGSAANTIFALAKLGIRCGFLGAVGDDEAGKELLKDFVRVGVDIGQIRVKKGARTGEALCLTDEGGRRTLYILPGANSLLTRDDIDLTYLEGTKLVHLSSFADEEQLELQKWLVRKLSPLVKVCFSPGAIYARKGLEASLPIIRGADIIFLNRKEMEALTGEGFVAGARELLEYGSKAVVVTLGEGERYTAYIADGEGEYRIESLFAARGGLETTGAGDAFAAGVIYGRLNGEGWEQSGRLGYLMAQACISQVGARAGLPSLEELAAKYEEYYGHP